MCTALVVYDVADAKFDMLIQDWRKKYGLDSDRKIGVELSIHRAQMAYRNGDFKKAMEEMQTVLKDILRG